jgi:hypothetical protein
MIRSFRLLGVILGVFLCNAGSAAFGALPGSFAHNTRFIEANGSYSYWTTHVDYYVRNTLPNEWSPSWDLETLKAGAVIIRSGVYWRINRSILNSPYPYNNCYKGTAGSFVYYRTAPQTRGGQEQFLVGSAQSWTNQASDGTYQFHAETVSLRPGRPDPFVGLRHGGEVQNRTRSGTGGWVDKIRYAVVGFGGFIDPNSECNQVDDQTNTDPKYVGQ